jgi:hypothetical protein
MLTDRIFKKAAGCLVIPVLAAVAMLLSSCGSSECVILANGGRKLCGSDAAAWCRSTDALREGHAGLSLNFSMQIEEAQRLCEKVESKH